MINYLKTSLVSAAMLISAGCAQISDLQPKNFGESVADAKFAVAQSRDTALALGQAGKITKEQAQNVQNQADLARDGIKVAEGLRSTKPAEAQTQLDLTQNILKAIQEFLVNHGAPK